MLVSRIDYNLLSDIMTFKQTVKQSVEGVLDEKLTASHLITDVHALMDLLDLLENQWRGTPPENDVALAGAATPAQAAPVQQPVAAVEPPVVAVEPPAVEDEQPVVAVEPPAAEAEQPVVAVEPPVTETEQPVAEIEELPDEIEPLPDEIEELPDELEPLPDEDQQI